MNTRLVAKVAVWIQAVALLIVGIALLTTRFVTIWELQPGTTDSYDVYDVDVSGVGLALLVVGLLVLAALLIIEGYGPARAARAETAPEAAEQTL